MENNFLNQKVNHKLIIKLLLETKFNSFQVYALRIIIKYLILKKMKNNI